MASDLARLREAASAARTLAEGPPGPQDDLYLALADWLDGEAAVIGETEAWVDLIAAVIENQSGIIGTLRLAHDEDGEVQMLSQSTPAAQRVADVLLRGSDA